LAPKRPKPAEITITVSRDGDRDIVFLGTLIGQGEANDYTARIYRTSSGKFIASLHYDHLSMHTKRGKVAENAEGVAEFFTEDRTSGDGKTRVTSRYLNDAGKLAMQDAAHVEPSFRERGFEIVE